MKNNLKVGQKICLYELTCDGGYSSLKEHGWKGKQAVGPVCVGDHAFGVHFLDCGPDIPRNSLEYTLMFPDEVKLIGTFVVKEVFNNREAETII